MTRFAFRAAALILKGLACLIGGLLFGALPLLAIVLWKVTANYVRSRRPKQQEE